jgi:hypothetical protein
MTVVWEVGKEQADSGSRPSVLVIGVQSSPNYRLQQSVHEQAVGNDSNKRVATQRGDRVGERKRITGHNF